MDRRRVTLAFMGDGMLGRGVNEVIAAHGPAYPWGRVLPLVKEADIKFLNLECTIAESGHPWSRTPKVFFFRAMPAAVETLRLAEIDFVALANNHSLDFEEEALDETMRRLDEAGIASSGAGINQTAAAAPAFIDKAGLKIGVISITDNDPGWAAGPDTPGVNFLEISIDSHAWDRLKKTIEATARTVDLVVLSAHWGPNMVERPPQEFRAFARATVAAGVDIFFGHSAHIFQGVEIYDGAVIMYDTGDFIDDYVVDPILRNDLSFLFLLEVEEKCLADLELVPVQISDFQVNPALREIGDVALAKMEQLCAEMETATMRHDNRLQIEIPRDSRWRARHKKEAA